MRRWTLLIALTTFALTIQAQWANIAECAFQQAHYDTAMLAYQQLLQKNPKSQLYLYRYARCAQQLGDYQTAIHYFDKAGDKYPLKYFYLGDIYMQLWQPQNAINAYQTYLQTLKTPNERTTFVHTQIQYAEKQIRFLKRVEKLYVIDSICVPLDSILSVCRLSAETGTLTYNRQGLIYTNQRGDRKLWTTTQDSTSLLVSAQRFLDQWTTPDTLPPTINISNRQLSPFVLNDGVTLYFASNDTNGLGGLDIYVSRLNTTTNTYTIPENLGYPFNSNANEYMLILDENQHVGYLATDRFATPGKVHIYSFIINENKEYWRNIPADSLAAYAQLKNFLHAPDHTPTQNEPQTNQTTNQTNQLTIHFILNDSTVYTSLDDFHNSNAQDMYRQWLNNELLQQEQYNKLQQLRQQYANAEPNTKKQLTPTILQLEQKLQNNTQESKLRLNTIRQIESAHK